MTFFTAWECANYIGNTILAPAVASPGIGTSPNQVQAVYTLDDTEVLPKFPCIDIADANLKRTMRGPHNPRLDVQVQIYVVHGLLNQTSSQRLIYDAQLARAVTVLLHGDRTLGGNIPEGWVATERPVKLSHQGFEAFVMAHELVWQGVIVEILTP